MTATLEGRVALVTGGSRGVGRAVARRLAASGAAVAVNYRRDEASAEEVVRAIEAAGGRARAYAAPVDDDEQVEAMVQRIAEELGPVDLLVSNAGTASTGKLATETSPQEYARLWSVHVGGLINTARHVLPGMRRADRGDVIVISSAVVTTPIPGGAPYTAAKAALDAVALTLAREERGAGIRVNILAPGLVATDMGDRLVRATSGHGAADELDAAYPFGRVCRPEDVAGLVSFLAGEEAGYITGQRIAVDGGGPVAASAAATPLVSSVSAEPHQGA